jgi:hypothetical protein
VPIDDLPQPVSRKPECLVPRDTLHQSVPAAAELRIEEPIIGLEHWREVNRLGTDVAEICGVIRIALHFGDTSVLDSDQ